MPTVGQQVEMPMQTTSTSTIGSWEVRGTYSGVLRYFLLLEPETIVEKLERLFFVNVRLSDLLIWVTYGYLRYET